MKKRVYGVLGIASRMANWNADFSGYPKTISSGEIFGSDKAFKYPMKKMWDNQDKKVLYIKSLNHKEGEAFFNPRTLAERYEYLFDSQVDKKTDSKELLKNLFACIDVKNFGATFAVAEKNISITGAVQLGQGFNKYLATEIEEQQILSPFRDPKAKEKSTVKATEGNEGKEGVEAKSSTLGSKIVCDEAHYFYPFTINPRTYKEFVELAVTDGYTEQDYAEFKKAALCAATSFATNAKAGCENEFGIFVETEEELFLPNLDAYIEFEKGETKNRITITCGELLKDLESRILAVQIYYNPYTLEITSDIEFAKKYNIFTMEEV